MLHNSPIYGPVHSRRLGLSLGINLLPAAGKVCTFDCLYCECGLNADNKAHSPLPTREEVRDKLESALQQMASAGNAADVLTFAGNGEPTVHPDFAGIIEDTIALRNKYCPEAKISVLSNATQLHRPDVVAALLRIDNNIQKLDAADEQLVHLLDQPNSNYRLASVIQNLQQFNGHVIIQTMFLQGSYNGTPINNTNDAQLHRYIEALQLIKPQQVMIYTIARTPPIATLQKATPTQLDHIATQLRTAGFPVSVAY